MTAFFTPANSLDLLLAEKPQLASMSSLDRRHFLANKYKRGYVKPSGQFASLDSPSYGVSGPVWVATNKSIEHFWQTEHATLGGGHRTLAWESAINVMAWLTDSVPLAVFFLRALSFSEEMFLDPRCDAKTRHPLQISKQPDLSLALTDHYLSLPFERTYQPPNSNFPSLYQVKSHINRVFATDLQLGELAGLFYDALKFHFHLQVHSIEAQIYAENWLKRRELERAFLNNGWLKYFYSLHKRESGHADLLGRTEVQSANWR